MSAPGFAHEALVYRDPSSFVDGAAVFVRDGLLAGESVFAVLPPHPAKLLREALGARAEEVHFLDVVEIGRNPARLIPAVRAQLAEADGRGVRGIGESAWLGRTADEFAEVALHEALINLAFADAANLTLRCAFDADVPPSVMATARRTHPCLLGGAHVPGAYDPEYALDLFTTPLPDPGEVSDMVHFCLDDLPELRDLVAVRARQFGLPRGRALDLTLATNEMVTNSICHGGERGTLRLWTEGESLVCEITDSGHITDPMVGRVAPLPSVQGGRGVWLANQLCDLVRIRSTPATGTMVRLHVRR
ncbi:sensor histidine kinase [Actinokineospora auranticolor]|uniref:Anti-sigma regulatory factor (Ser/Thr protein kinase) n=1 Tax=Actinokineospora auranticolor TaxID=155976 RepID=A0A2S6H0M2_9PSEU|nr:sensor histidine kinase [Actinokineospora auranticolor]PPK71008.1 anti-sigma regulatory factor (Ser/Thr protein kinase) [Actinokineospora auranticolor]